MALRLLAARNDRFPLSSVTLFIPQIRYSDTPFGLIHTNPVFEAFQNSFPGTGAAWDLQGFQKQVAGLALVYAPIMAHEFLLMISNEGTSSRSSGYDAKNVPFLFLLSLFTCRSADCMRTKLPNQRDWFQGRDNGSVFQASQTWTDWRRMGHGEIQAGKRDGWSWVNMVVIPWCTLYGRVSYLIQRKDHLSR